MVETNTPLAGQVLAPVADAALVAPVRKGPSGAAKRARRAARAAQAVDHAATWPAVYLDQYAVHGNLKLAAAAAGVEPKEVRARIKHDPAFAEQVKLAHEDFCDNLEHALVVLGINKNNALALLARLKAERPQKYQDELRINASMKAVVAHVVAPEAAVELLRLMVADATDATRAVIGQGTGTEGSRALCLPEKEAAHPLSLGHSALVLDAEPVSGLPAYAHGSAGGSASS